MPLDLLNLVLWGEVTFPGHRTLFGVLHGTLLTLTLMFPGNVPEMFREIILFLLLVPEQACFRNSPLGLFQGRS